MRALSERLLGLDVPIGWETTNPGGSAVQRATRIAGRLLTAFAVPDGPANDVVKPS